jgi:uncharacterized RDD family membrane protein YckC
MPPPPEPTMVSYAGFWKRVLAKLLDGLIISFPMTPVRIILGVKVTTKMFFHFDDSTPLADNEMWYLFIQLTLWWLYSAIMESSKFQATFGKIAVGIAVTDMAGNRISFALATGRNFAKSLSFITLFIGYMMAGWTKKKQALHDLIAGTLVVRTR